MSRVTQDSYGQTRDGSEVTRFTLTNKNDVVVRIINYGGTITEIRVPDRAGRVADICPGFEDMEGYQANPIYMGALVGRVADRIAGATFDLDGKTYNLNANDLQEAPNFLHGGTKGFDKMLWDATIEGNKLVLKYVSPDGEENFPGEVTTVVTYELDDDNGLTLEYTATTTKATPINLTNHVYFNLAGHGAGAAELENHVATVKADTYLPMNNLYIPTGEIKEVAGQPQDLRTPTRVGDRLHNPELGRGFTCNYNLQVTGNKEFAARFEHPGSGRYFECSTTEPALMFYTGHWLNNPGKGGAVYGRYSAFCLEAQHYPDSVHNPKFPSTILHPGETYRQSTTYRFGVMTS
ncbi:galactose mutarotase-like [Haliotis rufescens]|uniref:galactose mutarotase-like n=1 Tax=Haliotis rufescens TaxID=6454 RepID=UPI00201EC4CD|nr:galactose mutarotase-like [Haliotis rufescens]